MILDINDSTRLVDLDKICVALQTMAYVDKKTGEKVWKNKSFYSDWSQALGLLYNKPFMICDSTDSFLDEFENHVERMRKFIEEFKTKRPKIDDKWDIIPHKPKK